MFKKLYLNGEGDSIAPSIFLGLEDERDKSYFKRIEPISELTTREFVISHGYDVVDERDVEIRDMGELGKGLFAKSNIRKGQVVAIHGGTVSYNHIGHSNYKRDCTKREILNSFSISAMYHYCCIKGTGHSAADKVQHAFQ